MNPRFFSSRLQNGDSSFLFLDFIIQQLVLKILIKFRSMQGFLVQFESQKLGENPKCLELEMEHLEFTSSF